MDAKKALYRAKLKEAAQKKDKRIDSPLVRYNEHDQPVCRVCDIALKSESLWAAHQASRKHHEAIKNYKAIAAGKTRINEAKLEPLPEVMHKPQSSSALPADFFDKHDSKRQRTESKTDRLSDARVVDGEGRNKGPIPRQTSQTTSKVDGVGVGLVKGTLPEGFFDNKDGDPITKTPSDIEQVKGTLPKGFFDKDVRTTKSGDGSEAEQVKGVLPEGFLNKKDNNQVAKMGGSEVKQIKGALPEGFFDNKDADLRARGIEPVKIDIKDEYKEFEKLIQEDLHEVDERLEEEEIDAADVREEEENLEQKAYRERVEMLKKKQLELKAARFGGQKGSFMGKESSDEESSSSDEEDDKENFAVDWRAKHL